MRLRSRRNPGFVVHVRDAVVRNTTRAIGDLQDGHNIYIRPSFIVERDGLSILSDIRLVVAESISYRLQDLTRLPILNMFAVVQCNDDVQIGVTLYRRIARD